VRVVKLVLEGGGCRAAYTAGVLLALERAAVPVEAVVGSSSSATNAAYFAAGQMEACARVWAEVIPDGMISWARLVLPFTRPALDVDRMMDEVLQQGWSRLDLDRALAGKPALYVVATAVPSGEPVLARPTRADVFDWLRASSTLPVGYNKIIRIGAHDLVDGGISAPVPFDLPLETPVSGPTVVVLTRHVEKPKARPSAWERALLHLVTPAPVRGPTLRQHELYNALIPRLREQDARGELVLVPPPPDMTLSRLTRDPRKLQAGIDVGLRVGESLLRRLEALRAA
jgi:predicted patatin/cPLA2 family phospholipase